MKLERIGVIVTIVGIVGFASAATAALNIKEAAAHNTPKMFYTSNLGQASVSFDVHGNTPGEQGSIDAIAIYNPATGCKIEESTLSPGLNDTSLLQAEGSIYALLDSFLPPDTQRRLYKTTEREACANATATYR